jgi:hypothetical protein
MGSNRCRQRSTTVGPWGVLVHQRVDNGVGTTPEQILSAEDKRQALKRVLRSLVFARAEQLKSFLRYVCEMEIAGRAKEISEYSIATEALGRPSNYSPGEDSTVRCRAHDLRSKLQQFYDSEGRDQSVRIQLPKGSYAPFFIAAEPATPPPVEVPESSAPELPPVAPNGWKRGFGVGFAAATVLVTALVLAVRIIPVKAVESDSILREFWGPVLRPGANVLLCLGSPPALRMKPYREPPRSDAFELAPPEIAAWYSSLQLLNGGGRLYLYRRLDSPLFGDAAAAVTAARTLSGAHISFQLVAEASLRPPVLRGQNVLLVGSPNYSTFAARTLRRSPFSIREDPNLGEEVISDAPPESKPHRVFASHHDEAGALTVAYGLITVFPSETDQESGPRTVVISGIAGAGAQGAIEFFSSSAGLRLLRDHFRKDGIQHVPPCYQIVVRCSVDRSLLMNWELAAYQIMDRAPMLD